MRRARAPRVAVGPAGEDRLRYRRRRRGPVRGAGSSRSSRGPWSSRKWSRPVSGSAGSSSIGGVPGASIRVSKTWSGKQTGWTVHRSLRAAAGRSAPGEWLTFEAPGTDRRKGRLGLDPCVGLDHARARVVGERALRASTCAAVPGSSFLPRWGSRLFALRGSRDGYRYHLWRAAALPAAVAAFGGRGRCVHSLAGYRVTTGRNGPNTVFRRASPLVKARP